MAGGIFISYRRDDSRHAAGRLADRLGKSFSTDELFMDVDNIELGLDFVRVLNDKVAACDVMLVVIGPQWIDCRDEQGRRRLDDPHDFVRIEIEAALARDIRVVPVLVDGAGLPPVDQMPPTLQPLARRQAARITHESFGADVERIAGALERGLGRTAETRSPTPPPPAAVHGSSSPTLEQICEIASQIPRLPPVFFAGQIPADKEANARAATGLPATEPVLAVFDTSFSKTAKRCVVLTSSGIWTYAFLGGSNVSWQQFMSHPPKVKWSNEIDAGGVRLRVPDEFKHAVCQFLHILQTKLAKGG